MLSLCKESKYAAAKSSIILTSYWEFLSFDLMIPNSHKNLEMILIEKGSGNQLPQMMFINQCMTSIIILARLLQKTQPSTENTRDWSNKPL